MLSLELPHPLQDGTARYGLLLQLPQSTPTATQEIINTNHLIYLTVLDMRKLGKLVVSKHSIEYFNGQHHWKYTIRRNVVQLPTLLMPVRTEDN